MSKESAEYRTDEQIMTELAEISGDIKAGRPSDDEVERDAWFAAPANAEEAEAMLARMELVEKLYQARHDAGLTQQQLAEKSGLKQTYIAQIEKGRKNLTVSTIQKYVRACGRRLSFNLL